MKYIPIAKPIIEKEDIASVVSVLKSGNLASGQLVASFEKAFASYCGTKYAVSVSSGTTALHLALWSLGIGKGDEVITTPFTYIASVNAIHMVGATSIFCDIDADTFNLNPKKIEEKITKRTKAILVVDLFGLPYFVPEITELAKKYNLHIIEDAAQAHGASWKKTKTGNLGGVGCFSLYPTKNMVAGGGGVLTTNSKTVYEKCLLLRNNGHLHGSYNYQAFGLNYEMNEIAAALALAQLKKLDSRNAKRILHAQTLAKTLNGIKGFILPSSPLGYTHVYHQFTVRITKNAKLTRDTFMKKMQSNGIDCRVYYPKSLHLYPHIAALGYKKGDFPIAESITQEIVSVPIHPLVTDSELTYISTTITQLLS
jgi:dTDP-4-amino-4,6-dideoxygalactose transaminase